MGTKLAQNLKRLAQLMLRVLRCIKPKVVLAASVVLSIALLVIIAGADLDLVARLLSAIAAILSAYVALTRNSKSD